MSLLTRKSRLTKRDMVRRRTEESPARRTSIYEPAAPSDGQRLVYAYLGVARVYLRRPPQITAFLSDRVPNFRRDFASRVFGLDESGRFRRDLDARSQAGRPGPEMTASEVWTRCFSPGCCQ